jgi:hypothetical protein
MRFAGSGFSSDAVDIFNAISGEWSIAALSVARADLAATSLPDQGLAIFAGGVGMFFVVTNEITSCCMSWVVNGPWLVICFLGVGSAADSLCDVQVQMPLLFSLGVSRVVSWKTPTLEVLSRASFVLRASSIIAPAQPHAFRAAKGSTTTAVCPPSTAARALQELTAQRRAAATARIVLLALSMTSSTQAAAPLVLPARSTAKPVKKTKPRANIVLLVPTVPKVQSIVRFVP